MDVTKTFICNSVRPGTKRTYCTGEKRWIAVAEQIGTDILMRIVPNVWARRTDSMRDSSLTWPEACMIAFLTSCQDVGLAVSPKTAFFYLSAVRKYFQVKYFLKDSHYIQNTKAGMLNAYRMTLNRAVKDKERLPISIGIIQDFDAYLRQSLPTYGVVQMTVHAAQLLGYTTLSRVSEYLLVSAEAEHLLVSECVLFEMGSGCLVPSCEIIGRDLARVTG
jgi:hypothetical protein